jgi:ribosomal protein S12 methylthiotransferase accessory factor
MPADETLERIRSLMPVAGITRVADVTGLDTLGIPVVMVVRPNARSLSVAQGKGLDLAAAKVSGIMESIECFHAERVSGPVHIGRHADLIDNYDIVDPFTLPRLTTSQFRSTLTIPWIEALDLATGRVRLLPFEMVSTDFTSPGLPGSGFFGRSTNGLASGNSVVEAVLHGLCEVIERDAWALWHHSGGTTGGSIELAEEVDQRVVQLLERIQSSRCTLMVEDLTTDVGVPVFFARLTGGGHGSPATEAPAGGLGCHPDRTLALLRALCEAAQSRLTRIAGSRDDLMPQWYRDLQSTPARLPRQPSLSCSSDGAHNETIDEDLGWVEQRLISCGIMEWLVVNLARDDMGLAVLKVVVPGLEAPPELCCQPGTRARRYHEA